MRTSIVSSDPISPQPVAQQTHSAARQPRLKSELTLAIACPMANEGENAPRFVKALLEQCGGFQRVYFFAVVDGATTDNTIDLLQALAESESRLRVVWAPENRSVVDAYVRGYREALASGADWILEIDAGFSHLPTDAPALFDKMLMGYDCVFGSRFMPGGKISHASLWRRFVSRGGTSLANTFLGTTLTDMTSGFQLFSRGALEMVLRKGIQSRAHFFQTEMKTHCRGLRCGEVPIHYSNPSARLGSAALVESFRQLWRLSKDIRRGRV